MRKILWFVLMLPLLAQGQLTDDFSDGDFTQNPSWTGDAGHFKVTGSTAVPPEMRPALQLDAPAAGMSALAVAVPLSGALEWRFWAKLSMNTSSGNYARFYLLSDHPALKGPLSGYFLRIGGADDSVQFVRQDSLSEVGLLTLSLAFTGNSSNMLRFRIVRTAEGRWTFFCDPLGGQNLADAGGTDDLTFPAGSHAGVFCQYTSSNTTKFYFDEVYAGPMIVDTLAPALVEAVILPPRHIRLSFSEALLEEDAENPARYSLDHGIGSPDSAWLPDDPSRVMLAFGEPLSSGTAYRISVSSVSDLSGNQSGPLDLPVMFYRTRPYDLIITEVMPDPSPPRDLPEAEYLELFNRCGMKLSLEGLRLKAGSGDWTLPAYDLDPGGYVIVCDDEALEIMQHVAPSIGVPSFSLANTGAVLSLSDTSGMTLSCCAYHPDDFGGSGKAEGGWSLEMADPENPCVTEGNWFPSVSSEGGTPGSVNSVSAPVAADVKLLRACCTGKQSLVLEFSAAVDSSLMSDPRRYDGGVLGSPVSATAISPGFTSVILEFNVAFDAGMLYRISLSQGLVSCTGETAGGLIEAPFALPEPVSPFDVIINEILFNPIGDGVDYVELYNRSGKTASLEGLLLASVKTDETGIRDTQMVSLATTCRVMFPGTYLVLTSDPGVVQEQFQAGSGDVFLEMASFPSFNNDLGTVLLMNDEGVVTDGMNYSEEMHFLMLLSYEGVALERISTERPGTDPLNWHSAAATSGYGTPGYLNSQHLAMVPAEDALTLSARVFTPDSDGVDDHLGIGYTFESPGKLVTVMVFSSDGRLVRRLAYNDMPGTDGWYSWDGTLDDRTRAPDGLYVIYMESLGMDGRTRHFKKTAALVRRR